MLNVYSGTLRRGDQLLEANGQSLIGVSNERYLLNTIHIHLYFAMMS